MKTKTLFFGILLTGLIFTACNKEETPIVPSGQITSKSVVTDEFQELSVSSPFIVEVNFSSGETSAVVEANSNLHSVIEVRRNGKRLSVGLKENVRISGSPTLKLYITTPTLDWISLSGATSMDFTNAWEGDILELGLEGACKLSGEVYANEIYANLIGASEIDLSGSTNYLDLHAEGGSNFTGFEFSTKELFVSLIGACNASLSVNNEISVQAEGGSKLYYKGNAEIVNQNVSGGSEVIKMD